MSESESSAPKLTRTASYVNALYDLMDRESTLETIGGAEVVVWRGSITKACSMVGVPEGVYRRVVQLAEELEIIEILQTGNKGQPTIAVLHQPPTPEVWLRMKGEKISGEGLTQRDSVATLSRKVRDISDQLGGVNLGEALANHNQRIGQLEQLVQSLQERLDGQTETQKPQ